MKYALEVSNLKKIFYQNFKESEVLKWVNIQIENWQIYWFLWPNGSWKTTTLKCILWFLKYHDWKVEILWKDPTQDISVFKKIWYSPESAYFYDHLNWIEFLIFMWQLSWLNKQEAELNWLDLLEKLWISFAKLKLVKSYSKWMKQRLWLAASLINDPEIIFWDEPMSGLDPLGRVVVKDLMKNLKSQGKTIFFNTHILSDVQEISDKFWIINNWQIIYEDSTKNIHPNLEELFKEKIYENEKNLEIS